MKGGKKEIKTMVKGVGHLTGKKSSHYEFKKRCCIWGCKKRAKHLIDNKYYCKIHSR
jgi:hypothetical protein